MTVSTRQQGTVTILDLQGQITGDASLAKAVQNALDSGARKVLLNLTGIVMVDSSGIGEINKVLAAVNSRGGKLKLFVPSTVANIPGVSQLGSGYEIFRTEREAINSFN